MRYVYGELNVMRALDETEFWKRQEAEHAALIKAVTPGLEAEFTEGLSKFERAFREAETATLGVIEAASMACDNPTMRESGAFAEGCAWARACGEQSERFAAYLWKIMRESAAMKSNDLAKTVTEHIIREGEYYAGAVRGIVG